MEFEEPILSVCAFQGVTSYCAFAGKHGRIGVFDTETSSITFNYHNKEPTKCLRADDEKNIYFCDSKNIYRHDIRTRKPPEVIFTAKSNVLSFAKNDIRLVVSSEDNGIELHDERMLENKVDGSEISANLVDFIDYDTFVASYDDNSVRVWKYNSEVSQDLEIPEVVKANNLKCLGIGGFDKTLAVCYQSGISVYKKYSFSDYTTFGHTGQFESLCYAPCFENEYVAVATKDGSIFPVNLDTMEASTPMKFSGSKITSISANHLMLISASVDELGNDDCKSGYISTLMPEDFSDEFF